MSDQMNAVYIVGEIVQERDRLRRELDELRSAANERDAEITRLRSGAATAVDDLLTFITHGTYTGLSARNTAAEIKRVCSDLRHLLGVEDTTEEQP